MAGLDAPSNDWDADSDLSPLLMLAGLALVFGVFVVVATLRSEDRPDPMPANVNSLRTVEPEPTVSADTPEAVVVSENRGALEVAALTFIRPAVIAKSPPKTIRADLVKTVAVTAAIAEKAPGPTDVLDSWEHQLPEGQPLSESELTAYLAASVPSVGLNQKQAQIVRRAFRPRRSPKVRKKLNRPEDLVLAMLDEAAIESLPFSDSADCRLKDAEAFALDKFSRSLHTRISLAEASAHRRSRNSDLSDRDLSVAYVLEKGRNLHTEEAIPALVQILQVEPAHVREQLVKMLAEHQSAEATLALVDRAVFDLSPKVRNAANSALAERYHAGYRKELLDALRYPWSPVAWHAAETLVAVKDTGSMPQLIGLLEAPDPAKPHPDPAGNLVVDEMVRIHHVRNCLLCHPASRGTNDRVRGLVPDPFDASPPRHVPAVRSRSPYGGRDPLPDDALVRADVTYLRQDFSVMHDERDRFDYLLRTRAAKPEEIAALDATPADTALHYPQREAVLFALRKLSSQFAGHRSEDWRKLKF